MNKLNSSNIKGKIQYSFKGMQMHSEVGWIVMQENKVITVKRELDERLLNFIKVGRSWLLEKNTTNNSLLYGTRFVIDEKNI